MSTLIAIFRRRRLTLARRTTDRGSATVFVEAFAGVLFACAGLAIDGGRAINARDRVNDVAEQAARAGAGQLDDASLRAANGAVVLDVAAAKSVADSFVNQANPQYTPTTTVALDGLSVTVRVDATYHTAILGIVGINSMAVSGTATAGPATGVGP
jgi:Flp pilus assembly protein TadG